VGIHPFQMYKPPSPPSEREAVKYTARQVSDTIVRNYVGNDSTELAAALKNSLEQSLRDVLPAPVAVRIVEEDEDMQIVRHIHEEPLDLIQVEVQVTLDKPLEYLLIEFQAGASDERLGIQFVPVE
jgi:hypothetical protein